MSEPKNNKVINFGCRLNKMEGDIINTLMNKTSLKNSLVVNGCAVTNEAERQVKQNIRKIARENPNTNIIVTGCGVQLNKHEYSKINGVKAVIGNKEKRLLSTYQEIQNKLNNDQNLELPIVLVDDMTSIKTGALHLIDGCSSTCKGFVEIQNGCDHRCTFCTIHLARGKSFSHPIDKIIEQIRLLIDKGRKEIVLTGVDITSYGQDLEPLPNGKIPTLGYLCSKIIKNFSNLSRLRISSIDCITIDPELFEVIASEEKFMPHLHLSLQSGNNLILKRMLRRHQREQAISLCQRLHEIRKDLVLGCDLIAGFPSEDQQMFQDTINLIDECRLTWLHVFPFSARALAPASRMKRQIQQNIKKERASILRNKGLKIVEQWMQSRIGQNTQILVETIDHNGKIIGKDPYFAKTQIETKESDINNINIGDIVEAKIVSHSCETIYASL